MERVIRMDSIIAGRANHRWSLHTATHVLTAAKSHCTCTEIRLLCLFTIKQSPRCPHLPLVAVPRLAVGLDCTSLWRHM
jgi:hypothetical protein